MNFQKLFETVTKLYENLTITKVKFRILSDYQLQLLNQFYNVIKTRIHNDKDDSFEHMVSYWCTVKYMIECMEQWGESLNFIELNNELNNDLTSTFFDSIIRMYEDELLNKIIVYKLRVQFERLINKMMKPVYQAIVNDEPKNIRVGNLIKVLGNNLQFLSMCVSGVDMIKFKFELTEIICEYFKFSIIRAFRLKKVVASNLQTCFEELFDRLRLIMDDENYGTVVEMLKVFQVDQPADFSQFRILQEEEVRELEMRRLQ
ncbi:unnamed protein product [Ambrosiozyma monospora]|uniref:Unnamed protein product n=1 Tax=Ambrosiozyma monospora TaxID=43982 RepID=A0ACB5T216_AMBMO|nr:unnamed protein product [Ambrosiozyma monospora]